MESTPHEQFSRQTYDAEQAFALLGIPRSTGFDLVKRGAFPLPVIRAGRRISIPKAPLDRLLTGQAARDAADASRADEGTPQAA